VDNCRYIITEYDINKKINYIFHDYNIAKKIYDIYYNENIKSIDYKKRDVTLAADFFCETVEQGINTELFYSELIEFT